MCKAITGGIEKKDVMPFDERRQLVCVGGSARAVLKLGKKYYHLPDDTQYFKFKATQRFGDVTVQWRKGSDKFNIKINQRPCAYDRAGDYDFAACD